MLSGVREESEQIAEAGEGGCKGRRGWGAGHHTASPGQDNRFSYPGAETVQEEVLQG